MSFPTIPLEPVNLQAARMLSVTCDDLRKTPFYLGLLDEMKDLDADILRMETQIASHHGQENQWYRQCQYSLKLARSHRYSVYLTASNIGSMAVEIAAHRRKEAAHLRQIREHEEKIARKEANKTKQARLHAEKQAEVEKAQAKRDTELARLADIREGTAARDAARLERIRLANDEQNAFHTRFKKVVRNTVGPTRYLELIESAKNNSTPTLTK